jgi:hypothetical protein
MFKKFVDCPKATTILKLRRVPNSVTNVSRRMQFNQCRLVTINFLDRKRFLPSGSKNNVVRLKRPPLEGFANGTDELANRPEQAGIKTLSLTEKYSATLPKIVLNTPSAVAVAPFTCQI